LFIGENDAAFQDAHASETNWPRDAEASIAADTAHPSISLTDLDEQTQRYRSSWPHVLNLRPDC
jgi:hypothetical protein